MADGGVAPASASAASGANVTSGAASAPAYAGTNAHSSSPSLEQGVMGGGGAPALVSAKSGATVTSMGGAPARASVRSGAAATTTSSPRNSSSRVESEEAPPGAGGGASTSFSSRESSSVAPAAVGVAASREAAALASRRGATEEDYVHEFGHEHLHGQEQHHEHCMAFHTWWAPAAASRPLAAPWRWLQLAVETSQQAAVEEGESSFVATEEAATAAEPHQPKVLHLFAGQ